MKFIGKLESYVEGFQNDPNFDYDELSRFMCSEETQRQIGALLEKINTRKDYDKDDVLKIKYIIDLALAIYLENGLDTGLTDTEYDKFVEFYQLVTNNTSFTVPTASLKTSKISHKFPCLRGTLDKIYVLDKFDEYQKVNKHRNTLDHWIESTEKKLYLKTGRHFNLREEEVYVFPKWDGVSCIFEFNEDGKLLHVLNRGDIGLNLAKDVKVHFQNVTGKDYGVSYGMKAEVMVHNSDLEEYNLKYKKDYKQTRAIASAIVNSKSPDEEKEKLLHICVLRECKEGDEHDYLPVETLNDPWIKCKLYETDKIREFADQHRVTNDLRCDGVVIRFINEELIKLLGREDDISKFEVAYKFTEEYAYTKIIDIDFRMGPLGRLTPVAVIEPVKLKGNQISNVSLGSMPRYHQLMLSKGDTVKILYDIIPYLDIDKHCHISGKNPIPEPRYCPECGSMLERDGEVVSCKNHKCNWVIKGQILNYLSKRNILGISFMTIDKLYDAGYISDIADLYHLKDHKKSLYKMDGMGKLSVDQMLQKIEDSIYTSDIEFLGSIGLEGCSNKTAEVILRNYTLKDALNYALDNETKYFTILEGIGEKKATKFCKSVKRNKKLIQKLSEELRLYHRASLKRLFKVCFTKGRDEDLEKYIISQGGEISDNLTKDVDFIVVPKFGVTSMKLEKAKKYGIPVVEMEQVEGYIEKVLEEKRNGK